MNMEKFGVRFRLSVCLGLELMEYIRWSGRN